MFSLEDVRAEAEQLLVDAPDGAALDARARSLIELAVVASVTSLDPDAIEAAIDACSQAQIEPEAMQEIIGLVSGLGVHSLMEASRRLARRTGYVDRALDAPRQALWDARISNDPYWQAMEAEVPGFLRGLLSLSPDTFNAFFAYCAVPWKTRHVAAVTKELAAMACDASSSHRLRAGMRLHLSNALKLGAGRRAVTEALDIAASAPLHQGI